MIYLRFTVFQYLSADDINENCDHLTLSQTTNLRRFQIERVCRRQIEFDENGRKFPKSEHTVGKGEIARYKQFFLFAQCFKKTCIGDT